MISDIKGENMTKKERALRAVEILKALYPDAICSLTYETPFQLLVAVRRRGPGSGTRVKSF